MTRVHKSIQIKTPVDKVFSYIDNPMNHTEWYTNMIEVQDVIGNGVGKHFKWHWNMVGIKIKGESTYAEYIPNKQIILKNKSGVDATWDFKFETQKDVTTLDVVVDYTIPVPVLGKMAEKLILKRNERDLEIALMNLKDRLEL